MENRDKLLLSRKGDAEHRIGDNKRSPTRHLALLETIIDELAPLGVAGDMRPNKANYFDMFSYHDIMKGITIETNSHDTNIRIYEEAIREGTDREFPIGEVMDKYQLTRPRRRYPKVIMLPGSNSLQFVNRDILNRMMFSRDEWYIKPHPVTNEHHIKELCSVYGASRIIDADEGGINLLEQADEIATTYASELFVMARLLGKKVTNISKFSNEHELAYYPICKLLTGDDKTDIERINAMFMGELSGHVRSSNGSKLNRHITRRYYDKAMEYRNAFTPRAFVETIPIARDPRSWDGIDRSTPPR